MDGGCGNSPPVSRAESSVQRDHFILFSVLLFFVVVVVIVDLFVSPLEIKARSVLYDSAEILRPFKIFLYRN